MKVPSHNSLKACKGTMFFLPLPLEKTVQTLEEVQNDTARGIRRVCLSAFPTPFNNAMLSGYAALEFGV